MKLLLGFVLAVTPAWVAGQGSRIHILAWLTSLWSQKIPPNQLYDYKGRGCQSRSGYLRERCGLPGR